MAGTAGGSGSPSLRLDVVAGLTAAAVVIPKAMAYATIAGLPVQLGLYTALVPTLLYALVGTSRPLSVSTTTTLAILLGAELALPLTGADPATPERVAATVAFLVGAALLAAAVLRLGFVADFISEPVLVGFKAGIGLVIVLDQVPKLLGVHVGKGPFLHKLVATVGALPAASMATLAVGGLTIALLVGIEHLLPKVPAPLVAVAAGIAAASLFDLPAHGVALVGDIPTGLPTFVAPDLGLAGLLWPGALGIALMSFTETIAAGRAFARIGEPLPRPNRELLALGLANAGGALLGAMPAGGGTSQTAVNRRAGARTQLAGVVTAGATLLTMLLLAGLMGKLPLATLAAVVVVYSVGLIEPASFRAILRIRRMEFVWALVALVGVVALGTLEGIIVAIIASLVALALPGRRATGVPARAHAGHQRLPAADGRASGRRDGSRPSWCGSRGASSSPTRNTSSEEVRAPTAQHDPRVVAVDLSRVPDIEHSALETVNWRASSVWTDAGIDAPAAGGG